MEVIFYVWTFRDREPHVGENHGHFFHDLLHGMQRACGASNGQRHILCFAGERGIERGIFEVGFAAFDGGV